MTASGPASPIKAYVGLLTMAPSCILGANGPAPKIPENGRSPDLFSGAGAGNGAGSGPPNGPVPRMLEYGRGSFLVRSMKLSIRPRNLPPQSSKILRLVI